MAKIILADKQIRNLTVKKNNPLVRLPAHIFKNIDKRKSNIPMVMAFDKELVVVFVDTTKINNTDKEK